MPEVLAESRQKIGEFNPQSISNSCLAGHVSAMNGVY